MTTAQLVRELRRGAGLTQSALAKRSGISQSSLSAIESADHDTLVHSFNKIAAGAGYRLFLLPTTSNAAATWAEYIHDELRSARASEEVAFRALIGLSDDLTSAPAPLRVALCVAHPPLCGDPRFDAAIAAVVEYHLTKEGLPLPAWLGEPSRSLAEPWALSPYTDLEEVPVVFQRRGVLLAESDLASV